jgi:hypothetical protein
VDFHPAARAALAEACSWGFVDLLRQHHPTKQGSILIGIIARATPSNGVSAGASIT